MLSIPQKRYIDICAAKIAAPNKTREQLAAEFTCSMVTVDHAFAFGKRNDLFVLDTGEKVRLHTAELQSTVERLERILRKLMRKPRGVRRDEWHPPAAGIAAIARQLLDYRTRVMELEGLYRQTMAMQHSGPAGKPLRVQYEVVARPNGPSEN